MLDNSGSIRDNNVPGSDNWQMMIDFVKSIIELYTISPDVTRIAVVDFGQCLNYSSTVQCVFCNCLVLFDIIVFYISKVIRMHTKLHKTRQKMAIVDYYQQLQFNVKQYVFTNLLVGLLSTAKDVTNNYYATTVVSS